MTLCASGTVTLRKSSASSISGIPASLEEEGGGGSHAYRRGAQRTDVVHSIQTWCIAYRRGAQRTDVVHSVQAWCTEMVSTQVQQTNVFIHYMS